MKHYKLFTSVLSLHDQSCTTTCIDSLVYHYGMSSYFTFNMWLVTILTKVYFNRMVYLRTYTNGLVLIMMSLFDYYHILVNSTMQIVHITHNSVTPLGPDSTLTIMIIGVYCKYLKVTIYLVFYFMLY